MLIIFDEKLYQRLWQSPTKYNQMEFPCVMYMSFHKAWQESKSAEDKHALDVAKKEVYTAVITAQESKLQEFTADLQSESGRKNCFRIAKQMAREGRDVISVCCMKNDAGNVVSEADGMKNIWRKYMEKLLNVENDWDGEVDCPEVSHFGKRGCSSY